MDGQRHHMTRQPPGLLGGLLQMLLPPDSREAVLGDLAERSHTPGQYMAEGLRSLPPLVAGQARRASRLPVIGLQIFILFACLGGFELDRIDQALPNAARAGLPTILALICLMLRNVYHGASGPVRRGFMDGVTAALCVITEQLVVNALQASGVIGPGWALTRSLIVLATLAFPILWTLGAMENAETGGRVAREPLLNDYARFALRTRNRNRAEMVALSLIIGVSAYFLIRFNPPIAPVGFSFLTGYACVLVYLALRGGARALPLDADAASIAALYQTELQRQSRLRRLMWWFWFVPLFAGLLTNLIIVGITREQPVRILGGCVAIFLLGYLIERLHSDRRQVVQQKIDNLELASA